MTHDTETLELAAKLADRCAAEGWAILADGCVRPDAAAKLIGRSERTLENWRVSGSRRLPHKRGIGCLRYDLRDIAAALLADRVTP